MSKYNNFIMSHLDRKQLTHTHSETIEGEKRNIKFFLLKFIASHVQRIFVSLKLK